MPEYKTEGAAAFDLYARVDTTLKPSVPAIIPLNVVIKMPKGYMLALVVRSSTALKKGFNAANGLGVIDEDYSGDNDEVGLIALNYTKNDIVVKKGDRIAQGLIFKVAKATTFTKVSTMATKSRGGFGSTG